MDKPLEHNLKDFESEKKKHQVEIVMLF